MPNEVCGHRAPRPERAWGRSHAHAANKSAKLFRWQQSFDALAAVECRESQAALRRAIEDVLSVSSTNSIARLPSPSAGHTLYVPSPPTRSDAPHVAGKLGKPTRKQPNHASGGPTIVSCGASLDAGGQIRSETGSASDARTELCRRGRTGMVRLPAVDGGWNRAIDLAEILLTVFAFSGTPLARGDCITRRRIE